MAAERGEFTIENLRVLVAELNKDASRLARDDWRDVLREEFALTDQALKVLDDCPEDLHRALQECFHEAAEHVKGGGRIDLRVVRELDTQDDRALYLVVFQTSSGGHEPGRWFRIVCCDANCSDWHWCWRRPGPCPPGSTTTV